jgi:hypothetical protein
MKSCSISAVRATFERESESESPWTSYNASLGRPLLNSAKFLAPKPAAPPEDRSPAPEAEPEDVTDSPEETPTLPGLKA